MSFKSYIENNRKTLRKRKRLIAFLSILAVLGLSTATYAWFTVNTFVGVENFELRITTGEELRASMENHGSDIDQYVHTITNEMVNSYLKRDNTSIKDIILPPVTTKNGSTFTFRYGDPAKRNQDYLEYKAWFIGTKDMYVHLSTEGLDEEGNRQDGTKVTTKSPAPKNDVIRAIRIDFQTDDGGVSTYEPNKGPTQSTSLTTFDLPSGQMVYNNSNRLFHLDKLTPKLVTVRLWLEGEDPECDNDVRESEFTAQLSFVGCDANGNPIS